MKPELTAEQIVETVRDIQDAVMSLDSTEAGWDLRDQVMALASLVRELAAHVMTPIPVRPGDKLILHFHGRFTVDVAERLREQVRRLMPEVQCILIDETMSPAVYRKEPQ
jgi:hypothetical protein